MPARAVLMRSGAPQGLGRAGFSLMEVLIALVVGAILGLALLGVQFQSFKLTQSAKAVWESLNVGEEFFARQTADSLKDPTGGEVAWPEKDGVHFQLSLSDQPERGVRWYSLSMRSAGGVMGWEWPEPRIEWRALDSSGASGWASDQSQTDASKDAARSSGDSFGGGSFGGSSFGGGLSGGLSGGGTGK